MASGALGLAAAVGSVYAARALVPAVAATAQFVQSQVAMRSELLANTGHLLAKEAAMRASAAATVEATAADLAAAVAAQQRAREEVRVRADAAAHARDLDGSIGRTERIIRNEQAYAAALAARGAADARAAEAAAASTAALLAQQEAMARTTVSATLLSRSKDALTAVLGLVGGPWGAAFLAAAGAVYHLATRTTEADRAQETYNRTLATGRQRVQEMATATRDQAAALLAKQRDDLEAAQAELKKAQAAVAAAQALERQPSARGLGGAAAGAAMLNTAGTVTTLTKNVQAAAAALDALNSIGQKTGDAVGLEMASKLARGTGAFAALDKSTSEAMKSMGLVVQSGKLMTSEQADTEKSVQALNRAIAAGPGFLRTWGTSVSQVTQIIDAMKLKVDPVASAIADMNREIAQLQVPEGAARTALTLLQEINKGRPASAPLTTVSPEYLAQLSKARELETARVKAATDARATVLDLEKKITAAQTTGNDAEVARLTRDKAVEQMVAKGVDRKAAEANAEQDFAVAITAAGAAAGEAGKGFLRAADAQSRLAQAAGLGEAAARQAAYANKLAEEAAKGNGNVAAQAAANQREEAAAILQIRNETVRGLEIETANTNRLTEAMAAGGEKVRVAQEEEYKLALIRKLGSDATVAGTAAQKALNDAMEAYRQNRAANDNNRLQQERQSANENLALAQRELDLMGETETVRERALTTLRNQQDAARKVAELGADGARQWLDWQEKIADTRAMVSFQKEVRQTAKSISDDLAAKMFEKGGSIIDWWHNLLKRMAIEIASTQFIMPIVTQVVSTVPSLFGISSPGSTAAQATTGGSLLGNGASTLTNTAISKGAGWAADKLGLSGVTDKIMNTTLWGGSVASGALGSSLTGSGAIGLGSVSGGAASAAGVAAVPGGLTNAMAGAGSSTVGLGAVPSGMSAGGATISGILGSAGAGAFGGGLVGGTLGTATNSKVVGGLSGAAAGAGSAYLASIMGLSSIGGPIGIAIGAVVGAIMGMLGTTKATVGPNSSGNITLDGKGGLRTDVALADNGADASQMQSITNATASAMNTIITGIGAKLTGGDGLNTGLLQQFQKDGKWYVTPAVGENAGKRAEFTDQDQAIQYYMRESLRGLIANGQLTGANDDVRTALRTSKATKAEDLATDLGFAANFRQQFDVMTASLDPTNNQIKTFTEQAKTLGDQIKTNITDWRNKASELGLATEGQLTVAARRGIEAMMGLGPAVQPLSGLAAVTKQAEINVEAFRPALASLGYTAAEQADIVSRYAQKLKDDYVASVQLVQRQGAAALAGLTNPSASVSMSDRFRSSLGLDPTVAAVSGLVTTMQSVETAAGRGAVSMGQLQGALAQIDSALMAGTISGEQYTTLVNSLTTAWSTASGVLGALRQGAIAVEQAIDPSWRANLDARLSDTGMSGGAIEALRPTWQAVLDGATAGAVTAAQMRTALAALDGQLRAGTITADQHKSAVGVLTAAWQDSATAAEAAAQAADAAAQAATARTEQVASTWSSLLSTAIQDVSESWRTVASDAQQAATSWGNVADSLAQAGRDVMTDSTYSNLGPRGLRDAAQEEFQRLQRVITTYTDARTAGTATDAQRTAALDAAGQLDAAGKKYLEAQRAYSGDGTAYDQALADVRAVWDSTKQTGLTLKSAETRRAEDAEATVSRLEQLADTIATVQSTLLMTWDAGTSDANPGAGKLRASTAALTAGSYTLYVSTSDFAGADASGTLAGYSASSSATKGRLRVTKQGAAAVYMDLDVTGVTVASGYRKVAVTYVGGPGGFAVGDPLALGFVRVGDKGDVGGASLPAGSAAAPGLAVTGDPDTGLAQTGGANTLSGVAGGVEVLRMLATYLSFGGVTGTEGMRVSVGSYANRIRVEGRSSAGNAPIIWTEGLDANISLEVRLKGLGGCGLIDGNNAYMLQVLPVAGATRNLVITSSAGGDPGLGASGGAVGFTSPAKAKQANIAYASTITLDFATYQDFVIGDLTGPLTLANPATYPVGQRGEILLHEDAIGGRTVSFGANWIKIGKDTVNTAAGKYSVITYWVVSGSVVIYSIAGGA